jgi:hypothetical protein
VSFKDQVTADLPTFLDVDEFADTITVDGAAVACVLINDEAPGASEGDGISLLESTLYARAVDFDTPPVVRQRVTVNERQANIIRVNEEQGMLVIRLQWYNS